MHRSKLEMHINILQVLADHGPLKITHLMYKVNLNGSTLKDCIEFLIKQGLVEEKSVGRGRFVYAITQRGRIVINVFEELKELLPVTKESLVLL
jgi:predicted transcriptional regulator